MLEPPEFQATKISRFTNGDGQEVTRLDGDIPVDLEPEEGQRFLFISHDQSALTHGLHTYPAKFFPELPRWLIRKYSREGEWVLDPFAGSGTVSLEALLARRNSVGIDVDPFSKLLSRVKLTPLSEEPLGKAQAHLRDSVVDYRPGVVREEELPQFPYRDNWFNRPILEELAYIKGAIQDLPEGPLSTLNGQACQEMVDFFLVRFSSIIRGVSNADDHCTRTVIRKRLNKQVLPGDALRRFLKAIDTAVPRMAQFSQRCPQDVVALIPDGHDARCIGYPDSYFDLALTSPPYVNAVDYPRTHQLESYWLGVASGSLTPLKKMHVGNEAVSSQDYLIPRAIGLPEADQLLAQIYEKDPRRSFILYQFLVDMERNLEEVRRVLKPGGRYVVAIGSNRMRGYAVESWRHIMGLAQRVGLEVESYFFSEIINHFIKVPREERIGSDGILVLRK